MTETASSSFEPTLLEVFREQRGRIWGFLLRGAGADEVAEDLLQETFLRIWDRRRTLEMELEAGDREAMRRYLWRVARNLMIDEFRLRQRRRRVIREDAAEGPGRAAQAADLRPGAEEELEWQEGLQVVRETVGRVKNLEGRRCLELWLEGLSPEEIARQLRLRSGRVRGLIQRARSEVILKATDRFRSRQRAGERGGS